jgi:hypothetical protein
MALYPFMRSRAASFSRPSRALVSPRVLDASLRPTPCLPPSYMAEAAFDPGIKIEPAWKVSIVYGMPCAIYHQLPIAYYLAARFRNDFEQAVLYALNGGGQIRLIASSPAHLYAPNSGFPVFRSALSMALRMRLC